MSQASVGMPISKEFEPLRSYEAPEAIFSMALDNELTAAGIRDAIFNPSSLTAQERDTFRTRLKRETGDNLVTNTLIDVVLNPFVMLMFFTSPSAMKALSTGSGAIFNIRKDLGPFFRKHQPFLNVMGVSTAQHTYAGTPVPEILGQLMAGLEREGHAVGAQIEGPLSRLLQRHQLKSINPHDISNPDKKKVAQQINDALLVSLAGLDQDVVRSVPRATKNGIEYTTVTERALFRQGASEEILRDLGATEFRDAMRDMFRERYTKMFGKDGVAGFEVDPNKIIKMWRALRTYNASGGIAANKGDGIEFVAKMLGAEVDELADTAQFHSQEQFLKTITEAILRPLDSGVYFPRNIQKLENAGSLTPRDLFEAQQSRSFFASGAAVPRTTRSGFWNPEALQRVSASMGDANRTPFFREYVDAARKRIAESRNEGEAFRTFDMDFWGSSAKHIKDVNESIVLHLEEPGEAVLKVMEDTLGGLPEEAVKTGRLPAAARGKQGDFIGTPFSKVADDLRPEGGFSLADGLFQSYALMKTHGDKWAAENLRNVFLPRVLGRMGVKEGALFSSMMASKRMAAAFVNSPIGKTIKESGDWGRGWINRMEDMADPDIPFSRERGLSAGLAKYLYVSHLGLNLSSTIINSMQPFLLGATILPINSILKGYGKAFSELGSYMSARAAQGFKPLTQNERRALIQEHISFTNVNGDDLLEITPSLMNTLDVSFSGPRFGGGNRKDGVFDLFMKPFEKAEWLNRIVIGHAVDDATRTAAGGGPVNEAIRNVNIRRMVDETQFAGNALNTPRAFLSNPLFNNPLGRMFLNFPVRSAVGFFGVNPRISERPYLEGLANDFIRGMGVSAVIYEVGKNVFQADLSRGLFASSITDLAGGERFLTDENAYIPVPPIVDIPADFIKAAATGDVELFKRTLPRLIPGGVAISRALGGLPDTRQHLLGKLPSAIQKNYVDWQNPTAGGYVGVFASDGRLIDYQRPQDIVLRAAGLDLGRFREASEVDTFLLKQRDLTNQARRRYLHHLINGDVPKATAIAKAYERRTGMKLQVTQSHLKQAHRMKTVTRTERILDQMPSSVRPQYAPYLRRDRLGLPEGTSLEGSSGDRQGLRG